MAHINYHPAPGLGDLLPGFFVVPQNPIMAAEQAAVGNPVQTTRVPQMGELVRASFTVPQNPLLNALATVGRPPGMAGLACPYCDDAVALNGLGEFSLGGAFGSLTQNWQTWAMVGGGLLLVMLLMGRGNKSAYKSELSAAKADYYKRVQGAKTKYARRGARIARAAGAAAGAL
jgi:hypothetical protein